MSTECERVFSSAKKLINPMRSLPKTDNIEASEYLKAWWDCGMITQVGPESISVDGVFSSVDIIL
jgi:selenophosphate synthetase-related protein